MCKHIAPKKFHFMAGLPRSGSTLLASILNQNTKVFATHTSPMLDVLCANEYLLGSDNHAAKERISKAIINATWQHVPQQIIIDKHRGWGRNTAAIRQFFGDDFKMLVTTRDIPSVIASFVTLAEKNPGNNFIDHHLTASQIPITNETRAEIIWEHFVKDTWLSMQSAVNDSNPRNLMMVDYDDLVNHPHQTIANIYDYLDLPGSVNNHRLDQISNLAANEDMLAWGMDGLHTIRPTLHKTSRPAAEVIGQALCDKFSTNEYHFWK